MRLGLLGGTFDPPHLGHLIAAQDALEALSLDRVAFVPAARPPHKRDRQVTEAAHRLAMLRLAIGDDPRLALEPLELGRDGPSYTVDTVRELAARGDQLFLLMGTDQWNEFGSWREPQEICRLAAIGVLRRAGESAGGNDGQEATSPGSVHDVPVTRIDISSTLVRRAVAEGRSIRYLVPDAVAAYIEANALYRGPAGAGSATQDGYQFSNDRR